MVRKKVLIVDDSMTMRKFERLILGDQNYDISEASSGDEALSAAAVDRPDIVLLDVNMPSIDGIETHRRLRLLEGLADVPVLFITGMTEYPAGDNSPSNSVRFPVDARTAILRKPIHAASLRETVQQLLGDTPKA